jgi:hypothetical protein
VTRADGVAVGCLSCGVEVVLPTAAAHDLVQQARRFFGQHGDCLTTLDLRGYRVLNRAIAHDRTPAPRAAGE